MSYTVDTLYPYNIFELEFNQLSSTKDWCRTQEEARVMQAERRVNYLTNKSEQTNKHARKKLRKSVKKYNIKIETILDESPELFI